jgi:predicted nucleic acid-binding protein
VLYLDSSAIVKLLQDERETEALQSYLVERGPFLSSVISRVETRRAVARFDWAEPRPIEALFQEFTFVELSPEVMEHAAMLEPRLMRTLDALQLATALSLGEDLEALVTYDRRMIEAAAYHGLPVASPGMATA